MTRERRDILARAGLPADRQGAVLAKYVWWGSRTCGSLFSNCFAISSSDGKPPAVTSDARVNVQYDSLLLVGIVTVGHGLSTTLRSFCLPLVPAPLLFEIYPWIYAGARGYCARRPGGRLWGDD